jgi:hypothetical protein
VAKLFFFKGNCLCTPTYLTRKECVEKIGSFDRRYAQLPDYDYWIRLCTKYEIHIIPENLIKFRIRNNNANASGQRPEVIIREQFEKIQILKNYLKSEICDNFSKIFPFKFIRNNRQIEFTKEYVPFLIGTLALAVESSPAHKYFGLSTIYEMLGDTKLAQNLRDEYSFEYKEFFELTGKIDIFNILSAEKV